ncbi:MAG: DUF4330 family protein [Clostridia bacterium]|nr:DUF4330 family protein [Clostridia bacterium]
MEKEKKVGIRRRFNVLDAVLILLAVLCIVGVWQRKNLQELFASGETLEEYTITFEVRELRSTTVDLLTKDTAFYLVDGEDTVALGTLTENVSASAATVYLQKPDDGETVEAVYPQDEYDYRLDVKGALACRGTLHEEHFHVEGKVHLTVNQVIRIYSEKVDLEIRITGIERVE